MAFISPFVVMTRPGNHRNLLEFRGHFRGIRIPKHAGSHLVHPVQRISVPHGTYAAPQRTEENLVGRHRPEANDDATTTAGSVESLKKVDTRTTKQKLLELLESPQNLDTQRNSVMQHIQELEGLRATPITDTFTELALSGEWHLLFSSTPTKPTGNIRIRRIVQAFDSEKKYIYNRVLWSYEAPDHTQRVLAALTVESSYRFIGPGRLEILLVDHKVTIIDTVEKEEGSIDMQAIILELQRTLPADFFDPSGEVEVSYIEPDFRIATFVGQRLPGMRNVFVRREKQSQAQTPEPT